MARWGGAAWGTVPWGQCLGHSPCSWLQPLPCAPCSQHCTGSWNPSVPCEQPPALTLSPTATWTLPLLQQDQETHSWGAGTEASTEGASTEEAATGPGQWDCSAPGCTWLGRPRSPRVSVPVHSVEGGQRPAGDASRGRRGRLEADGRNTWDIRGIRGQEDASATRLVVGFWP